jgi:hypothetical protein
MVGVFGLGGFPTLSPTPFYCSQFRSISISKIRMSRARVFTANILANITARELRGVQGKQYRQREMWKRSINETFFLGLSIV